MKWVFDHLNVIIVVATVIAVWLNRRRRDKAGEAVDYDDDGIPDNPNGRRKIDSDQPDPEEAERSRRIQEEIRRKIAGRRGGAELPPRLPAETLTRSDPRPSAAGPVEAPRPTFSSPLEEMLRRFADPREEEAARARAAEAEKATLERQRHLQEQVRALENSRQRDDERAAVFRQATTVTPDLRKAPPSTRGELLRNLRGLQTLRRAMVLREVLGPPTGLR